MKGESGGSHTRQADHHCILCCSLLYSQGLLSCSPAKAKKYHVENLLEGPSASVPSSAQAHGHKLKQGRLVVVLRQTFKA